MTSAYAVEVKDANKQICERCKRYTADRYGTPCVRCLQAMSTGWE